MKSLINQFVIPLPFLLVIFGTMLSAGTAGKISGKVLDENGDPLIGCNIILKGTLIGTSSNEKGQFYILNVPPGNYDISASMIGYATLTIKNINVIVDLNEKVNFQLNSKTIEGDEVVVLAKKPTVRMDQTSTSAIINAESIENLPVSEISDLIELQAGVVKNESGGFHIRGGRTGEVSFWVDGISTTDSYDNSSGLEIENSGIQEVQVISGTFNAEYGQAMSGIINVVTKDGSDKLEGNLNFYSGGFHTYQTDLYSISSPFSSWKSFDDLNQNGKWDYGEILYDENGNGTYDSGEAYWDLNGNNQWDGNDYMEAINSDVGTDGYLGDFYDGNGDGNYTQPSIGEGNGRKDWGEHRFVLDENGYVNYLNLFDNPFQQINLIGSLGGPVSLISSKLSFYSNIRYFKSSGRFYGKNLFKPNGEFGDENIVALSPFEKIAGQIKLTWKKSQQSKFSISTFTTKKTYRNYDSHYKYNPEGIQWNYEKDLSFLTNYTRTLSPKTFFEIKFLNFLSNYKQDLYKRVGNTPLESIIIQESDIDQYSLNDSALVQTGYDTYLLLPRYLLNENESGDFTLIDRQDDVGYIASDQFQSPAWSFGNGGTQNGRFSRKTSFNQFKFDVTTQLNSINLLKAGFLFKKYNLKVSDKYIVPENVGSELISPSGDVIGFNALGGSRISPFSPTINPSFTTSNNQLNVYPEEIALYLQNKIELDEIILNLGIRFDYFNPKWKTPIDPKIPENRKYYFARTLNDTITFWEHEVQQLGETVSILDSLNLYGAIQMENLLTALNSNNNHLSNQIDSILNANRWTYGYQTANSSYQLSPRLGIAYPISDRGVIHISYGHFFQIPQFSFLYDNPEFEISNTTNGGILGNANLKPEKTVMYEIGIKQEIARLTSIDFTVFYRDTRDWVGISPTIKKYPVGNYRKYQNMDYANTRGYTIMLERQFYKNFGLNIDYSWMLAEGTYSNPTDAYFDALNDQAPRLGMIPLNWDQTHTLNMRITTGLDNWMASIIGNFWSGKPYTPEFKIGSNAGSSTFSGFEDNSGKKPSVLSFDLRLSYQLKLLGISSMAYFNIYNFFDNRNELSVWSDTGRATYTLTAKDVTTTDPLRIGNLNEHLLKPEWYAEPRKVDIGIKFLF